MPEYRRTWLFEPGTGTAAGTADAPHQQTRAGLAGLAGGVEVRKANYPLRLKASLKSEAERVAWAEGTTLNQFINLAAAEKRSALRTTDCFRGRGARADTGMALALLERAGDEPPRERSGRPAGRDDRTAQPQGRR